MNRTARTPAVRPRNEAHRFRIGSQDADVVFGNSRRQQAGAERLGGPRGTIGLGRWNLHELFEDGARLGAIGCRK
jgi:hypothetical protein